ncbi:acyl-CoA dehydrogenase family protein [Neobacillus novalis]|uniref:Acyl-CoA dehydrogenase n=1 Tax=Neobacillus novalis TaxID=220687 RepID=A0AA95SAQ7_9BACI|nr:acyl-CoA dehydrogenase family protein [Neobacillus novalis]WHY84133.1 acyl-CoA dehydrogenase family protein [Neobacillus novalis]
MEFKLSDELLAIKALARDFTNEEIMPVARKYDEEEKFPEEVFQKLRDIGLFNLAVPEKYGGPGIDKISQALIVEEISRGCAGIATSCEGNSLVSYPILISGTEEQKKKYLGRLTYGGQFGSFSLTEPEAGSDVASLSTTIERKGDEYILNGEKVFITNANHSNFYVVLAKHKGSEKPKRFTALIVDRDFGGVSVGEKEKKMGLRASATGSIRFEDVRVPIANRIGSEGEGFQLFMKALAYGRPMVGALSVGIAQGAYEAALNYAKERKQFGKPISQFQSIQFMLADMAMNIEAARLLVYKSAYLLQQGTPSPTVGAFAKCFASDTAMKVTTDAVQIFGGNGYMREYPVEKYMRDAKITQIYEGTNQIQRVVIAKEILK